ncbi:MAG TPA: hypothetical protein PKN48_00220 [Bacteroidales bacterium]|nr:hypothetical protein [Bacteroidales bacterium]
MDSIDIVPVGLFNTIGGIIGLGDVGGVDGHEPVCTDPDIAPYIIEESKVKGLSVLETYLLVLIYISFK